MNSIEFHCPNCHARLVVPGDAAGEIAECPSCGQQSQVPGTAATAPPPPPPPPLRSTAAESERFAGAQPSWQQETNPYAAPTTVSDPLPERESDARSLMHQRITVGGVLSTTFEIVQNRFWDVLRFGFIIVGLYLVSAFLTTPVNFFIQFAQPAPEVAFALTMVNAVWSQLVFSLMFAVAMLYGLNMVEGRPDPGRGTLNLRPYVLRILGAQILIALITGAVVMVFGMVLLFVFGVFMFQGGGPNEGLVAVILFAMFVSATVCYMLVFLRLAFTQLFILEQDCNVTESLGESFRYTKGNVLTLFLLWLVVTLLGIPFVLITLFSGLLLLLPFCVLAVAVSYRMATGRTVVTQRLAE